MICNTKSWKTKKTLLTFNEVNDMTNVHVITKTGKTYTQDGQKWIQDYLAQNYCVTDELWLIMGNISNDPNAYLESLKKYPASYTILSLSDAIIVIPPEHNDDLILDMQEYIQDGDTRTTWELLKDLNAEILA